MSKRRLVFWGAGLMTLVGLTLLVGVSYGTFEFSSLEILSILGGAAHPHAEIIWELRLPRVVQAVLAGGILTLGGFFMQVLVRNPLADPYIMGLSAGAGLGVNLIIIGWIPAMALGIYIYPLMAGLGGLASVFLVIVLGRRAMLGNYSKLLIAGVAVASVFTALTGLLIYKFNDADQLEQLVYWTFGSFSRATWSSVGISTGLWIAAAGGGWAMAQRLDILLMGETQAQHLGIRVGRMRYAILLLASLTVGGLVAFTGPIGFVGMMVPHFARNLFGMSHRVNMLLAPFLGGAFLAACDVLSRILVPPAGLPIGIITAILGVPFFLYLLMKKDLSI